jgi:hypothetical protein
VTLGRIGRQIAYTRVGGHFQKVAFFTTREALAEPSGPTKLVVSDNPGVRETWAVLLEEVVRDLDLRLEVNLFGNARLLAALGAPAPFHGKIEPAVDEGGIATSSVGQVNTGL